MAYYQVILNVEYEDDKGKVKTKKEHYLVKADSVEEASNIMRMKEAEFGGRDYDIDTVKNTKFIEVFLKP